MLCGCIREAPVAVDIIPFGMKVASEIFMDYNQFLVAMFSNIIT